MHPLMVIRQGLVTCLAVCSIHSLGQEGAGTGSREPIIQYDFSMPGIGGVVTNLVGEGRHALLQGGAQVVAGADGGFLRFNGHDAYLEVQNASDIHLGDPGMTIMTTVRLANDAKVVDAPNAMDMFLWKADEFLFGRTSWGEGNQLYWNIYDASQKRWVRHGAPKGGLRKDEWLHLCVIIRRVDELAQGKVGYQCTLFINGEKVESAFLRGEAAKGEGPLLIGQGFGGGGWFLDGDMADFTLYARAISEAEFEDQLAKVTLAKVRARTRRTLEPVVSRQVDELRMLAQAHHREGRSDYLQLTEAIALALQSTEALPLMPMLKTVRSLMDQRAEHAGDAFSALHPAWTFMHSPELEIAFYRVDANHVVLCGIFDKQSGRNLLGSSESLWTHRYGVIGSDKEHALDSLDDGLSCTLKMDGPHSAVMTWTHPESGPGFAGMTRVRFDVVNGRLELSIEVENHAPQAVLREVVFPRLALRRFSANGDRLLVPYQSGVEQPPETGYSELYPKGEASMQFFAHYDSNRGVYLGVEDPMAGSKRLECSGFTDTRGVFSTTWFVGHARDHGGNGFVSSGSAALEPFSGNWFDAAQIYKRFAKTASWWPASRTREDSPAWFKEMTCWILLHADPNWKGIDDVIAFRNYLGLPVGLHLYGWQQEAFNTRYPHFTPRDGMPDVMKRLQDHGVRVKPYTDVRLWDTTLEDYPSLGLPSAAKNRDGTVSVENYGARYGGRDLAIMCPAAPGFQKTILDVLQETANLGVDALYLDQTAAGAPVICHDPSHGHDLGCGKAWLQGGFWPLLKALRQRLRLKHPELAFDSEDSAEPYLHVLDGFLPWRYTVAPGSVPSFQSIYAGRVQFTGRGHSGDRRTQYPKAALQFLFGEQLGWLHRTQLQDAMFCHFIKKLAYARQAFLPFFNAGDAMKPLTYAEPMEKVAGNFGVHTPVMDTAPALLNGVWKLDDTVLILFVNSIGREVQANLSSWTGEEPRAASDVQMFIAGQEVVTRPWDPASPGSVRVPGYGLCVWLVHPRGNRSPRRVETEAAAIRLFERFRSFETEDRMTPQRALADYASGKP